MTRVQRKAARALLAKCVVIYARVSTEEQERSGAGLEAQISECHAYAERAGLTVVGVVIEAAVSGKVLPESRPGFARALQMLDACEASGLLVRRDDRVSRNLRHLLGVIDRAKATGWSIVTSDGSFDTSTADGEFKVHVMAAVAERERKVIGERTKEALAAKRASGVRLGRPTEIPGEVLARIRAEHAQGQSLRAIARTLTDESVPTARGGSVWSHATVQAVLRARDAGDGPARAVSQ